MLISKVIFTEQFHMARFMGLTYDVSYWSVGGLCLRQVMLQG